MQRIIRYSCLYLLALFVPLLLAGQTITLDFPSCEYLQYHLSLKQGTKLDTVAMGRFDAQGKACFSLPESQTDFRGVGVLTVTGTNRSVNVILNGEEKVLLQESELDSGEVLVLESKENTTLKELMHRQGEIVSKYVSFMQAEQEQNKQTYLVFELPQIRKTALENEYTSFWSSLNDSSLYAPGMVKLMSLLSGYGSALNLSAEQTNQELQEYIVENLDLQDLYTSGFWELTLEAWCMLTSANDSLLLAQSWEMLSRVNDVPLRRELTQILIRQFSKYAKDNLLSELGEEYLTIPVYGKPAPLILTDSTAIKPFHSLILFYDPDCGNCHNELRQLAEKYPLLANSHNNMRVISISADTNKEDFNTLSARYPWGDKFCDFKGFDGDNFKNYGIVGTPTYILVDDEGIIRGRYARLSELFAEDI